MYPRPDNRSILYPADRIRSVRRTSSQMQVLRHWGCSKTSKPMALVAGIMVCTWPIGWQLFTNPTFSLPKLWLSPPDRNHGCAVDIIIWIFVTKTLWSRKSCPLVDRNTKKWACVSSVMTTWMRHSGLSFWFGLVQVRPFLGRRRP